MERLSRRDLLRKGALVTASLLTGCNILTLEDNQKTARAERTSRPTPEPGATSMVIGAWEMTQDAHIDTPVPSATPKPESAQNIDQNKAKDINTWAKWITGGLLGGGLVAWACSRSKSKPPRT